MVRATFDKIFDSIDIGRAQEDSNTYTLGVIGKHNVVLAYMPGMGSTSATTVATGLKASYCNIKIAFIVGICGASPVNINTNTRQDIVLGDCIVSTAVVQYDFGRQHPGQFIRKDDIEDVLGRPNPMTRGFLAKLQSSQDLKTRLAFHLKLLQQKKPEASYPGRHKDHLYSPTYLHKHHGTDPVCNECINEIGICTRNCDAIGCEEKYLIRRSNSEGQSSDSEIDCVPGLHFGRYGSANTVLKSGSDRDQLVEADRLIAFEMEAAGVWDILPTVIVKSACDYADSHKSKEYGRWGIRSAKVIHFKDIPFKDILYDPVPSKQTFRRTRNQATGARASVTG